jgi:D-beta-D-heptose 7-phosphate kinase/D-beta-D-heptose 1-phosphate adenosyltransferase
MYNILLIGDNCTDIYKYGTIDRISPEAPVPVFKFSHEESKPGMAGNVKLNLEAFGCRVNFLHGSASAKTRLIDLRSRQHIVRIDVDSSSDPILFDTAVPESYDAVVVSDYNKGTIGYQTIEDIRNFYKGPIFVDTKKHDLARFEGCIVKINSQEFSLAKSVPTDLIVTAGDLGAYFKDINYPTDKVEVVDVCGAGDTFLSALVFEYLNTRDMIKSIKYANKASSIAVQHSGVYVLTSDNIRSIKIDS